MRDHRCQKLVTHRLNGSKFMRACGSPAKKFAIVHSLSKPQAFCPDCWNDCVDPLDHDSELSLDEYESMLDVREVYDG